MLEMITLNGNYTKGKTQYNIVQQQYCLHNNIVQQQYC